MSRTIAIATVSLVLSFPTLSFASGHMDLYTKPTSQSEVKNEIKGAGVEKDFTSFYTSPKSMRKPFINARCAIERRASLDHRCSN
ncbi:MAG: hypothetical protein WBD99_02960 [Thermodesulfobacteriota bacterium]